MATHHADLCFAWKLAHLNKVVVDASAIGQEEAAARGEAIKEEELLLGAQQAVVPLLRFLHAVLVVFHALLVWKGDAINSLQRQWQYQMTMSDAAMKHLYAGPSFALACQGLHVLTLPCCSCKNNRRE